MVSKADREYLRELKQAEPFTGYRERTTAGEECKLQILGRGEMAFYQQGDRALLLEVLAGRGVVFAYSIRRWDDGKKVTDEEREVVIEMMSRVMQKLGHEKVEIVRK
jgi:hypothetical protein